MAKELVNNIQNKGTIVETDPEKNEAADKALRIIMGDDPEADMEDEDSDYGVPVEIVTKAGRALANRYIFAVAMDEDALFAMITPARHFEKEGYCSDQSGPISHLLPRCGEIMESTWEFYDDKIKTPLQAAQHLQAQGFHWNADFQDFIDASLTKSLSAALSDNNAVERKSITLMIKKDKGNMPKK